MYNAGRKREAFVARVRQNGIVRTRIGSGERGAVNSSNPVRMR
jgi:hypothetical protein